MSEINKIIMNINYMFKVIIALCYFFIKCLFAIKVLQSLYTFSDWFHILPISLQ